MIEPMEKPEPDEKEYRAWQEKAAPSQVPAPCDCSVPDWVAAQIVSDYEGLHVGADTHQIMTEQLEFRIARALRSALDGTLNNEPMLGCPAWPERKE